MVRFSKAIGSRSLLASLLASLVWATGDGLVLANVRTQPAFQISRSFPKPSMNNGTPRTTTGGGSRNANGSCLNQKEGAPPMTALIPGDALSTTASVSPSLAIYLPQTAARSVEAIVKEVAIEAEEFQEVYQQELVLPSALKENPGIVTLKLDGVKLEPNKLYKWTVSVLCDAEDRSKAVTISGLFQRQELDADLKRQIESATPVQRPQLYAQAGIWSEALTSAANLRTSEPRAWTELLQSVELNEFVSAPWLE